MNTNTVQGLVLSQSHLLRTITELPQDVRQRRLLEPVASNRATSDARVPLLQQARGFFFWKNSVLRLGLSPTPGASDDETIVLLGPSLRFPTPVVLQTSTLGDHSLSLAEETVAKSLRIPTLSPETSLPSNTPNPSGDTNKDLHWDASDPLFAVFGRVFPYYPGLKAPLNLKLTDKIPEAIKDWDPLFAAWYRAHKYLFDHNASKSLCGHSLMFNHQCINQADVPKGLLHNDVSPVEYQLLDPESDDHKAFLASWDEFIQSCTLAARGTELISSPSASSASSSVGPTASPFLEKWAEAQSKTPSALAAQEDQNVKNHVINNFRLLFGRVKDVPYDDGKVKKEFVPAELSKSFKTFLGMKSGSRATLYFQNAFKQFAQGLDNMNAYERNFDFDLRVCQHAFVAALQHFRFLTTSLNLTPEDIGNGLCLFHFLPPQPGSIQYKTMLEDNHTITLQEQMGEDKSKIEKKSSVLYYGGRIDTVADFHKTIATFIVFINFAVKGFSYSEMPLVAHWLHKYASVLTRGAPLQWVNKHSGISHLPASLLIDANSILQGCVEVATNFKVVDSLASDDPISPDLWDSVQKLADTMCTTLSNAIYSGTLGSFREKPMVMDYLTLSSSSSTSAESHNSGRKRSAQSSSSTKDSDNKKSKTADSQASTPGLLKWNGPSTKLPIPPNIKMMCSATNKEARFCAKWLYQGHTCPHGSACKMAHLNRVDHLNLESQKLFNKWVDETDYVEYTRKPSRG